MPKKISVALVEDNSAFRTSIESMLQLCDDMECTGVFEGAEACIEAIKRKSLKAEVFLLDLSLGGKHGLTLIPSLCRYDPKIRILVLTQDDDYHSALEAIRLGVAGYILKNSSIADIERAIRDVSEGGCVIDPHLAGLVLEALGSPAQKGSSLLSTREREVLELLAMGFLKKEVAEQLGLSYYTIVEYTENIFRKLQSNNIAAAIATAIRKGLI